MTSTWPHWTRRSPGSPAASRLGADGERFTIADGYAGCDLIDAVVNDAAAMR